MADQQHISILQRMAGQRDTDVEDNPLTSSRAVRTVLAKVAQDTVGLGLTVSGIEEVIQPLDDMLGDLSDDLMLVGLHKGADLAGVAAIDMQLRAATLEIQTIGMVSENAVDPRPATNTDKRMCDPLLAGLLKMLPGAVAGTEFAGWLDGATAGDMLQSVRSAGLLLSDHPYRVLRLRVALGTAAREGMIALILPPNVPQIAPQPVVSDKGNWPGAFQAAVAQAPMVFEAELCRFPMSIGKAESLSPGDIVPLDGCTVASVRLRSLDGRVVKRARLGQSNGKRAVRIAAEQLPEMAELATMSADLSALQPDQVLPNDLEMPEPLLADALPDENPLPVATALDDDLADTLSLDTEMADTSFMAMETEMADLGD